MTANGRVGGLTPPAPSYIPCARTEARVPQAGASMKWTLADSPMGRVRMRNVTWFLVAFLYGSCPFVHLLARQRGVDLRRTGSGAVGGSNLWAATGTIRGVAGWFADASKGIMPVVLGRRLGYSEAVSQYSAFFGLAGQCWPATLRFNGGRGISAFLGAMLALDRIAWRMTLVPLIAGSVWRVANLQRRGRGAVGDQLRTTRSKSVPLGSFIGVLAAPLLYTMRYWPARTPSHASWLLAGCVLVRRVTARQLEGDRQESGFRPAVLLNRLLYDRDSSC
jgi:acyl-phosphate glycerol 3-phosphate acyltransferase